MSVPLEVEEIAVGDYSPDYGTVKSVSDQGLEVRIIFENGTEITQPKGNQLTIDQGGRFNRPEE